MQVPSSREDKFHQKSNSLTKPHQQPSVLPKVGTPSLECPNEGTTKLSELNDVAHGDVHSKSGLSHALRNQTHLEVAQEVFPIEVSARGNPQLADSRKVLGDSDQARVESFAAESDVNRKIVSASNRVNGWQSLPHGYEVVLRQFVLQRRGEAPFRSSVA
jgi:hypothetical protein